MNLHPQSHTPTLKCLLWSNYNHAHVEPAWYCLTKQVLIFLGIKMEIFLTTMFMAYVRVFTTLLTVKIFRRVCFFKVTRTLPISGNNSKNPRQSQCSLCFCVGLYVRRHLVSCFITKWLKSDQCHRNVCWLVRNFNNQRYQLVLVQKIVPWPSLNIYINPKALLPTCKITLHKNRMLAIFSVRVSFKAIYSMVIFGDACQESLRALDIHFMTFDLPPSSFSS